MNGVLRGKVLPTAKFLKALEDRALYLPSSAFLVSIDGRYSGSIDEGFAYQDPDMRMVPDVSTLCLAPAAVRARPMSSPTPSTWTAGHGWPRRAMCSRAVLDLYRQRGWRAVVAPELEFYLTAPNPGSGSAADGPGRPQRPRRKRAASL